MGAVSAAALEEIPLTEPEALPDPTDTAAPAETQAPAEPQGPQAKGAAGKIVGVNQVNVRKQPKVSSELVTQLKQGTEVIVYSTTEEENAVWAETNEGWIAKQYVLINEDIPPRDPSLGQLGRVNNKFVNIRSKPTVQSDLVGSLLRGDRVKLYEVKTEAGVRWGRTDNGWVAMEYIKLPAGVTLPEY